MGDEGTRHDRGGRTTGGDSSKRASGGAGARLGGHRRRVDVDAVMGKIATECQADRYCRQTYGDPERTLGPRAQRVQSDRYEVDVEGTMVTIDAEALERAVRWVTAPAVLGPSHAPGSARRGSRGLLARAHVLFAQTLSGGAAAVRRLRAEVRHRAATSPRRHAVGDVPDRRRHRRLGARPAGLGRRPRPRRRTPLKGVPTLALYGAHDPFAAPDYIRERLDG